MFPILFAELSYMSNIRIIPSRLPPMPNLWHLNVCVYLSVFVIFVEGSRAYEWKNIHLEACNLKGNCLAQIYTYPTNYVVDEIWTSGLSLNNIFSPLLVHITCISVLYVHIFSSLQMWKGGWLYMHDLSGTCMLLHMPT
jgi:hypothetical protein